MYAPGPNCRLLDVVQALESPYQPDFLNWIFTVVGRKDVSTSTSGLSLSGHFIRRPHTKRLGT